MIRSTLKSFLRATQPLLRIQTRYLNGITPGRSMARTPPRVRSMVKRWLFALVSALPPLLVVGVLAAVAYWGHETEWKAPEFGAVSRKLYALVGIEGDEKDK